MPPAEVGSAGGERGLRVGGPAVVVWNKVLASIGECSRHACEDMLSGDGSANSLRAVPVRDRSVYSPAFRVVA